MFKEICILPGMKSRIFLHGDLLVDVGLPIEKAWILQKTGYLIALINYTAQRTSPRFRNLIAYSFEGTLIWEAELPTATGADAYVSADIGNDGLNAFSFSCFHCLIDTNSGHIIGKTFTK